ncbi:hypothetical protein OG871_36035 [Kitasatospora sp. NBC_00374]|uniref:hypothetical protein n=1 Tax=Kitasatospora sp. NBC_00374 TaxID=2975964 RepID=UPI003254D97D
MTHVDGSRSGYAKLLDASNNVVCTLGKLSPAPGGTVRIQDDGNVVFYDTNGNATWDTGTYGFQQGNLGPPRGRRRAGPPVCLLEALLDPSAPRHRREPAIGRRPRASRGRRARSFRLRARHRRQRAWAAASASEFWMPRLA